MKLLTELSSIRQTLPGYDGFRCGHKIGVGDWNPYPSFF